MLRKFWNLCCSLKLAIYLASAITLLLMGGSLLIPFHSDIFGSMDQLPAGDWLQHVASSQTGKTWWFYLAAILTGLFGLNTLCCFLDWLMQFTTRWRKSGEYLLHLGVCLVLIAYFWGSMAGWRHNSMSFRVGETTPLPNWPGHYLRVDSFQPGMQQNGPPKDMISMVSLFNSGQLLAAGKVQINHPLLYNGVVITPVSFWQQPIGFRAMLPGAPAAKLTAGNRIQLPAGYQIDVLRFLPDAFRNANGENSYRHDRVGTPAFELRLTGSTGMVWQGWYFTNEAFPRSLKQQGIHLRLLAPIYETYSALTVNYDPGVRLAAIGSGFMTIGVLLALSSFYRKRLRQDRPEI